MLPSLTSARRWLSFSLAAMFRRSDVIGEVLPKKEEAVDDALNSNESIREAVNIKDDEDLNGDAKLKKVCRRASAIISAGFAASDGSYAGTILNISETGAFIGYDQDLKPINYINVRLSLPEKKKRHCSKK